MLPSLEGFSGEINLDLKKSNFFGVKIDDFKFNGKLERGVVENAKIDFGIYDGNFSYAGFLGLKSFKSIDGKYQLRKASLKPILENFANVDDINGIINISANISSSASSKSEFINNLSSNAKYSIASPILFEYGLEDLVKKMFRPRSNYEELKTSDQILFNAKNVTKYNQATGELLTSKGLGKINVSLKGGLYNSVLSGNFNLVLNEIDLLYNTIFITGTKKDQIALKILTKIIGDFNQYNQRTNLDQVREYLGLPRENMAIKAKEKFELKEKNRLEKDASDKKNELDQIEKDLKNELQNIDPTLFNGVDLNDPTVQQFLQSSPEYRKIVEQRILDQKNSNK
jgi:hypothetical protein